MRNVVLAVAIVAFGFVSGVNGPTTPMATGLKSTPATEKTGQKTTTGPYSKDAANAANDDSPAFVLDEHLGTRPAEFLIATVPDPDHTHLSLYFDRALESILRAAQAAGYVFERYWLPWRREAEPAFSNRKDRLDDEKEKEDLQKQPGLLLFHSGLEKQGKALVVLLLGEAPTAGINRDQFNNAIGLIKTGMVVVQKRPLLQEVRVVGPTFSGSLWSLDRLVDENPAVKFRIVSGSASELVSERAFRRKANADYHVVTHSDAFACEALWQYLNKRDRGPDKRDRGPGDRVILSESGTTYGRFSSDQVGCDKFAHIQFPREIGRLRNAFDEVADVASPPGSAAPGVPLKIRDSQTGHDTVPAMSGDQTPLAQEATLLRIAETLRRNRVRYAGLLASDVLDVLFLSRFLRTACPDVRLFLLNADELFVRATATLPFEGILALSTYPMVPANQIWTGATSDSRAFDSNFAEAVYNATLAQIDAGGPLAEYTPPEGPGAGTLPPPVWLTAVGGDGFQPLAILKEDDTAEDGLLLTPPSKTKPGGLRPDPVPRIWIWLCGLIALGSLWFLVLLVIGRFSDIGLAQDFCLQPGMDGRDTRAFCLLVVALSLAGLECTVLAPMWILHYFQEEKYAATCFFSALLLGIALLLSAFYLSCLCLHRTPGAPKCRAAMGIAWMSFLTYTGLLAFTLRPGPEHAEWFFAFRGVDLGSRLSPLPPILFLLLAVASWGWTHLQRIIFSQERFQWMPCLNDLFSEGLGPRIEELNKSEQVFWFGNKKVGLTVAALTAASPSLIGYSQFRTLEPQPFDWLYIASVSGVLVMIAVNAARFLGVWWKLRRILAALELHPLRHSFGALPPDSFWSAVWQQGARKRNYVLLTRSLDCLRNLIACANYPYREWLLPKAANLEEQMRIVVSKAGSERRLTMAEAGVLQTHLRDVADQLVMILQPVWGRGSSESWEAKQAKEKDLSQGTPAPAGDVHEEKANTLAGEFLALRYVTYIRYHLLHLRNLLMFLSTAFILIVLSLKSYPFQSPNVLSGAATVVFLILGVVTLSFLVEVERDATMSRITNSKAGQLDAGFVMRVLSYGALPLLTVIASHFPAAGRFLFSWLAPALQAMH